MGVRSEEKLLPAFRRAMTWSCAAVMKGSGAPYEADMLHVHQSHTGDAANGQHRPDFVRLASFSLLAP